ncbi:MAG: hypothetical protein M1833_004666 [Piccolia ochrophora]|nr:MAG: hypothetical protein M1833_004666 [Piccolia ochrophora]
MADHRAFFYGTLMAPPVLHRVIHGTTQPLPWQTALLTIRPAILQHHCRHKVRGSDYPAITRSPDDCVRGTLVTGLTEGDLWRLDLFEGDEYVRETVKVRVLAEGKELAETAEAGREGSEEEEEEMVTAQTYIWSAPASLLEEGEWDFDVFRREKMRRWVSGDENGEYAAIAEVDEAVKAQGAEGDPTGGRGVNGKISGQLDEGKRNETIRSAV